MSLDVLDDDGNGRVSDVIAACDWILAHKDEYNIRVANLSLNAGGSAFYADPLDHAVESLWLNGVVVVVASGNYGTDAGPSGVVYSPANDPFVITVGADTTNGTTSTSDDYAAPWSAWGSTYEGFSKPEVAAPGRWMRGAVPSSSSLKSDFPDRAISYNYMWMSGTSFAAPVVSGIAATILSRHPSWTPDQVKGALMLTTSLPNGYTVGGALGVGIVNGTAAMATRRSGQSERRPEPVRLDGFGDRAEGLRRLRVAVRSVRERLLEQRVLELRLLVERFLVERVLELRLLVERVLELGLLVERVLVEQHRRAGLVGEQRELRRARATAELARRALTPTRSSPGASTRRRRRRG